MNQTLFELLPLLGFFVAYKYCGLIVATSILIALTILTTLVSYLKKRKIAFFPLCTAVIVMIFGGLTVWTKDSTFIKIKPTVIYLLFALILYVGLKYKKFIIRALLGKILDLMDSQWKMVTKQWILFFVLCACVNEIVWRNLSEEMWINVKVFVFPLCTILFTFMQILILRKFLITSE